MDTDQPAADQIAQRFDTRLAAGMAADYHHTAWVLRQTADFPIDIPDPAAFVALLETDPATKAIFQRLELAMEDMDNTVRNTTARLLEAREMGRGPSGPPRRITADPAKFTGEIKDSSERQIAFLNFWSQLARNWVTDGRCFLMSADSKVGTEDFLKLNQIPGLLEGEAPDPLAHQLRYHLYEPD